MTSKYNEKQKAYTIKYIKENYDEIKLRLPKGFKNNLKQHIEKHRDKLPENCHNMQGYIKNAINKNMLEDDEIL